MGQRLNLEQNFLNQAIQMLDEPVMPVVYFVVVSCEILGDPMVKIGITIDPQRRFNELEQEINKENKYPGWLSQGIVEDITILGYVQGTQFLETTFHRAFKSKALGREWFRYDEEMESIIDGILCDYCVCEQCLAADVISGSSVPFPQLKQKLSTEVIHSR